MKKQVSTIIVAFVVAVVLVLYLFSFQVRENEVAIVLTFGKPTATIRDPGLYWKWPAPVQKVQRYDDRLQVFDDRVEETLTRDRKNVIVTATVGWRVASGETPDGKDGALFFREKTGDFLTAQDRLQSLISDRKNDVIGQYNLENFVSTDPAEMKFAEIEDRMIQEIRGMALSQYGIDVELFRIKRLELPQEATQNVYARMRQERQQEIKEYESQGEAQAMEIRAAADEYKQKILADARAEAQQIMGEGEQEVARYSEIFRKRPELAVWLRSIEALEKVTAKRTTAILSNEDSLVRSITQDIDLQKVITGSDDDLVEDEETAEAPPARDDVSVEEGR